MALYAHAVNEELLDELIADIPYHHNLRCAPDRRETGKREKMKERVTVTRRTQSLETPSELGV
jgi:hypothetical protein